MKRQILFYLIAVCVFGASGAPCVLAQHRELVQDIAPGCGAVTGRVLDEKARPVLGVKVYSMVVDRPPRGRLFSSITDAQGIFLLRCAEPGTNAIYTSKEDDDYPDTALTPFIDRKIIPVVGVAERKMIGGVTVHLPPRAGKLIGQIIDATTQQPLEDVKLNICRLNSPSSCFPINPNSQGKGQFFLLVPPIVFTLKASAPGYNSWDHVRDSGKRQTRAIRIIPGATKRLTIPLVPIRVSQK